MDKPEDQKSTLQRTQKTTQIIKSRRLSLRNMARHIIPRAIRIERVRWKRYPKWLVEHAFMAQQSNASQSAFEHLLSTLNSPLCRPGVEVDSALQKGKETNVRRAVSLLHGTVIESGQLFSYHHLVGRPSRRRGFVPGPELHNQKLSSGIGGGCCQVTNMLYQLALLAGLEIVERHRHSLDLFADSNRSVPFGCGATVFYNRADLRFRNTLPCNVRLDLRIEQGILTGCLQTQDEVDFWVEIFEREHSFFQAQGHWFRQNTLWRRILSLDGQVLDEHPVEQNLATTLYTPQNPNEPYPELTLRSTHCKDRQRAIRGLLAEPEDELYEAGV